MAPQLRPLPPPPRRSVNPDRASRRRVSSYREADSDSDDLGAFNSDGEFLPGYEDDAVGYPFDVIRRTKRPEAPRDNDRDGSANTTQSSSSQSPNDAAPVPPKITRSSSRQAKTSLFRKTRVKSMQIASFPKKRKRNDLVQYDAPTTDPSTIPPWQALPYHILREIFQYVWDLSVKGPYGAYDIKRMQGVARLCRTFFDAAIGVIWYSPPMYPYKKLARLQQQLAQPQDELFTNYRNKVRELVIHLPCYTSQKWNLPELVSHTPMLRHLRILEYEWRGGGRLAYVTNWDEIFDALDANNVRLHSWDWNAGVMFIPKGISLDALPIQHARPLFTSLRTLRFVNFSDGYLVEPSDFPSFDDDQEIRTYRSQFAEVMRHLPDIRHLEFSNCSFVTEQVLLSLPTSLHSLTLNRCDEITSEELSVYLLTHGQALRELELTHNKQLSMSFTTQLANLCPNLEVFIFGFNANTPTDSRYRPSYVEGNEYIDLESLSEAEVPTWPKALRHLELNRPGRWNEYVTEKVLSSLIGAAGDLPDLRVLIVNVILEMSWRSRASFRKTWESKLNKAFKRVCPPPNPNLCTLRKPEPDSVPENGAVNDKPSESSPKKPSPKKATKDPHLLLNHRPKRRIRRVSSYKDISDDDGTPDGDGDVEMSSPSKADPSPTQSGDGEQSEETHLAHVQGMCDVVELRFDNMRPVEVPRTADDFVDDTEGSDDEDWAAELEQAHEETYAW
ncbi:hypothetical protein KEM55_002085 [Ascosphaera atra]|nr:hypothetical protein KEM55_002085 [Ascosphaera atra]